MEFYINQYVKVKDGTPLEETGEPIFNWAGKIMGIYPDSNTCLIKLDAITLAYLDDDYLLNCIEDGLEAFEYIFETSELIAAERRDTDKEYQAACEEISSRMEELEGEEDDDDDDYEDDDYGALSEKQIMPWLEEFQSSIHFEQLTDAQKNDMPFAVSLFGDYAWKYHDTLANEWSPGIVEDVCLNIVPRKTSAKIQLFENYGDIMFAFFTFLGEKEYIDNAEELCKRINKLKKQIPIHAANPRNWGPAKAFFMEMAERGIDMEDKAAIDRFMQEKQLAALGNLPEKPKLHEANPYSKIGRNDKVNVKYTDGTEKKQVKFKQVEQDLKDRKCELM